jgi:hypothetical protein
VTAEAGGEQATLHLNVVSPSLRYRKVRELAVPSGLNAAIRELLPPDTPLVSTSALGAAMLLRMHLTPLSVSFVGLEFRERECAADRIWGYYDTYRTDYRAALAGHNASTEWTPVEQDNAVAAPDIVAQHFNASLLRWPITAGGYRFLIPTEYRIGSQVFSFARATPQAVQMEPARGSDRAPFHGTFRVWKGGQEVSATH